MERLKNREKDFSTKMTSSFPSHHLLSVKYFLSPFFKEVYEKSPEKFIEVLVTLLMKPWKIFFPL